jgi:hypothetical protein
MEVPSPRRSSSAAMAAAICCRQQQRNNASNKPFSRKASDKQRHAAARAYLAHSLVVDGRRRSLGARGRCSGGRAREEQRGGGDVPAASCAVRGHGAARERCGLAGQAAVQGEHCAAEHRFCWSCWLLLGVGSTGFGGITSCGDFKDSDAVAQDVSRLRGYARRSARQGTESQ